MKIAITHLTKRFGATHALDDLSLTIGPGRIVALVGVNGAGKTTMLHLLGSVLVPTSGTIEFDGQRLTRDRLDLRRRVALLPDRPPVFPELTAIQHIGAYVRLYEAQRPGVEDLAVSLLSEFDLLPLAEVPLQQLSRGQVYKAALAAVIAADPEVWLFDEPFASGMDPRGLAALRRHVAKAVARGRTVIYSTQIVEIAETFSDELVVLDGGQLLAHDTFANLQSAAGSVERVLERMLTEPRTQA